MKFGEQILARQHEPWAVYYLDYSLLKEELACDQRAFVKALEAQLEKILCFVLEEEGRIARNLHELRQEQRRSSVLESQYWDTATDLLHLLQFLDLNVTGLRKILKKHDKHSGTKLMPVYFGGSDPLVVALLGEESIGALVSLLETGLVELRQPAIAPDTPALLSSLTPLQRSHKRFQSEASLTSAISTSHPDYVLWQIHVARRRLRQTSELVQYLATTLLLSEGSIHDGDDDETLHDHQLSNLLNLLSTFLYMTNYYIVAPTSGHYAQQLGGSPALAGMIIGMTPVAALLSTLLYSWWTSHSYKHALCFASCCSCLGNILYALGLPYHSLSLVLWGRLLNGFGSARSINRRYIADAYAPRDRTAASATFVTAGALGMATGPAIASALHWTIWDTSNVWWQAENSIGWTMAIAWLVYFVTLVLYFENPPRKEDGLGEQKRLLGSEHDKDDENASYQMNGDRALLSSRSTEPLEVPVWRNVPVLTTFWVYFVLKLVLECSLSSTSMLTHYYFGWDASAVGVYLAVLGLLVLPTNGVVVNLVTRYGWEDRQWIVGLLVGITVGCVLLLQFSSVYSWHHYVLGSVTIFLATNALEGPNMSLLSKTIPHSWRRGIFNVGLLATEAGTLGRAVGDVFLTVCGHQGLEYLLNRCFGALCGVSFVTTVLSMLLYSHLEPLEKDE